MKIGKILDIKGGDGNLLSQIIDDPKGKEVAPEAVFCEESFSRMIRQRIHKLIH